MLKNAVLGLACTIWMSAQACASPAQLETGAALLAQVAAAPVRSFSTTDFGREQHAGARSVLVPEAAAERLLVQVRQKLGPGLVAFVGVTNSLARPKPAGVELVVAEGRDQFDILRTAQTDGVNYDLDTEAIVKELQSWDREFGIDIWQAETDTVQLRLKTIPKDLASFAQRIHKFCPDVVDQGVGGVRALAKEIEKTKSVYLWWD